MMRYHLHGRSPRPGIAAFPGQRGSVLILALVMLLLLTLVGMAGVQNSTLQERMAGNMRDRNLALQAAEAALREAEAFLAGAIVLDNFNANANGLYQANATERPRWIGAQTNQGAGALAHSGYAGGAQHPEYFIEHLAMVPVAGMETETGTVVPESGYFRITARGFGNAQDTVVVLRSVFRNR